MAVLAADLAHEWTDGIREAYPIKASAAIIYQGAIVMVSTSTGLAEKGADSANMVCVGIALEQVDNSAGAASAKFVRVRQTGCVDLAVTVGTVPVAAAWIGMDVYIVDDNHVDLVAVTSQDVKVCRVTAVLNSTTVRVRLNPMA